MAICRRAIGDRIIGMQIGTGIAQISVCWRIAARRCRLSKRESARLQSGGSFSLRLLDLATHVACLKVSNRGKLSRPPPIIVIRETDGRPGISSTETPECMPTPVPPPQIGVTLPIL